MPNMGPAPCGNTGLFDSDSVESRSGSVAGVVCRDVGADEVGDTAGTRDGRCEYCSMRRTGGGRSMRRIIAERKIICAQHSVSIPRKVS